MRLNDGLINHCLEWLHKRRVSIRLECLLRTLTIAASLVTFHEFAGGNRLDQ
jgi:hypothetical protein